MQHALAAAILRLHSPLSLRAWDALTITAAMTFIALAAPFLLNGERVAAVASAVGGFLILLRCRWDQRQHLATVWRLAAETDDPIEALAMYEYLYRLCFRDLVVLGRWRAEREALGLPVLVAEPGAPPQVLAAVAHLRACPREP